MTLSYAAEQVYKLAYARCVDVYEKRSPKTSSEETAAWAKSCADRFWPLYVKEALYEELMRTKERLRMSAEDNMRLFKIVDAFHKEQEMQTWYVQFTGHTLSGLGGGAMSPVTVESHCTIEAKDFEEASKKALLVGNAIKQGIYSVERYNPETEEFEEVEETDDRGDLIPPHKPKAKADETLDDILGSKK